MIGSLKSVVCVISSAYCILFDSLPPFLSLSALTLFLPPFPILSSLSGSFATVSSTNISATSYCEKCPSNGVACANGLLTLADNWWHDPGRHTCQHTHILTLSYTLKRSRSDRSNHSHSDTVTVSLPEEQISASTKFYRCEFDGICTPKAVVTSANRENFSPTVWEVLCSDGHEGLLCSQCTVGYTKVGGFCYPCPPDSVILIWALFVTFFLIAIAGLLVRFGLEEDRVGELTPLVTMKAILNYFYLASLLLYVKVDWSTPLRFLWLTAGMMSGAMMPSIEVSLVCF